MIFDIEFNEDDEKSIREFAEAHYAGNAGAWVRDLIISQTNPAGFQVKMGTIYAKAETKAKGATQAAYVTNSTGDAAREPRAAAARRISD